MAVLLLLRRVAAVGEDGLAGDPPAVGRKEFYDGHDVLNFSQLAGHRLRLVVRHALRCFLSRGTNGYARFV
jgi:hypothetical protein